MQNAQTVFIVHKNLSCKNSEYALFWSLENLIDPDKDELLLLSVGVLTDVSPFEYEYTAASRNLLPQSEIELQKKQHLTYESYVNSSSDPTNYIIEFIREHNVDALVIGDQGIENEINPNENNVGNVSQRCCIHSAMCTVIIARKKRK
ncbi:736_t:CDS:2 [Diversispora eburnea]|uniref:736_t:CDS:1 n=1 Tax=Diversispora eburnea TaxID=1213867 RepID=A0A9N9BBB0_9GLOM|nr:736_t:CDS:2 [Diversispora eburnea]